ncbi:hypothetical protein ATO6_17815 [Oceanicola sp. 22II-s10i]|uniref:hypothetical protein n=1 Tax=Oceanicola sp. 22II-s10i TaxID=1317116 RepID=UPI000B700D79|nr:hypothetical protein [Oceanicola sp. 22II-s10i]OWU83713.1 hypothetical protein ATO6_17815 [Oceanicola sp. 22II-s10i]
MLVSPAGNWEMLLSTQTAHDISVPGSWTVDGQSHETEFYSYEGWYRVPVDGPERRTLAAGRTLVVQTPTEYEAFQLDGMTAMLLKMQECWESATNPSPDSNKAPVEALPKPGTGAETPRDATRAVYGQARGWTIYSTTAYGEYSGCRMERGGGFDFSLTRNVGYWTFSLPVSLPQDTLADVILDIDRYSFDLRMIASSSGELTARIDPALVQRIAQAGVIQVVVNGASHGLSASGTQAAISKIGECDDRRGRTAAAAPAPSPRLPDRNAQPGIKPVPPHIRIPGGDSDAYKMGTGCPAVGSVKSPNLQDWGNITFVNRSDRAVLIYWLDYDGLPVEMAGLGRNEQIYINSTAGHFFVAKDSDFACHGGVIEVPLGENTHTIR